MTVHITDYKSKNAAFICVSFNMELKNHLSMS